MPAKKPLKKVRCVACRQLAETVLMGRCPRCTAVDNALASGWQPSSSIVKVVQRSDRYRLTLSIMSEGNGNWRLVAYEKAPGGQKHQAELGFKTDLIDAVRDGDLFARRWVEREPGTSIAVYVPRPLS